MRRCCGIEAGQCQGLAIVEASRGSRTLTQWSAFLDLCRKHRVLIWVVTHERVYDPTRRQDWRTLAEEGLNAADESERLSERIRSGKRKAARDGNPAGPLTFGLLRMYDEKGKLREVVPHPTQAAIRVDIVQRVADGDKLAVIADDLNTDGVSTARGGAWTALTVRSVALSPLNVGHRVHQGQDFGPAIWKPLVKQTVWRQRGDPTDRSSSRRSTPAEATR